MATLNGTQINNTYVGLIKTTDNGILTLVEKEITDGDGNSSTLKLGTTSASFVGTLDLTGATVLGGGGGGLVSGTGTNSMKSAAFLTTLPANASGVNDIALGNNARTQTTASGQLSTDSIAIGNGALATELTISIGKNATTNGYQDAHCIAIGTDTVASNGGGVAVGRTATATGQGGTAIGNTARATGTGSVSLGRNTTAGAAGAVAIGDGVTASITNTASIKALEVQTDSTPTAGGIIMSDAGGTDRRININASGALQIDSTPVGGGGGVTSIIAGSGISVDTSTGDVTVTATGGGGGGGLNQVYQLKNPVTYAAPSFGQIFGVRPFVPFQSTPTSTINVPASTNEAFYLPFIIEAGTFIDTIYVNQSGAANVGDTMEFAIFDSVVTGGKLYPAQRLVTLGANVPAETNQTITITGINYTLPANTAGCYFIAWSSNGTSSAGPNLRGGNPAVNTTYAITSPGNWGLVGLAVRGNDRTMPDNKTTGWGASLGASTAFIGFQS
jgi:hypothetical protein